MAFSDVLVELRKKAGLTVQQLADALGVSYGVVMNWQSGKTLPQISTAIKIADYFSVPLDVLYGRCSEREARAVLCNYQEYFMCLRRAPWEEYLRHKSQHKITPIGDAPYPYNLLDAVNGGEVDFILEDDTGLNSALGTLSEREQRCMLLYYKDGKVLDDVAALECVTRERVRQIIAHALRILHHPSRWQLITAGSFTVEQCIEFSRERHELMNRLETAERRAQQLEQQAQPDLPPEPDAITLDTPIGLLDLSVRAFNCLIRAGFNTLGDILEANESQLMAVRNMGRKCYDEISKKVEPYRGLVRENG